MTISNDTLDGDVFSEIRTILVAAAPSVIDSLASPTVVSAAINATFNDKQLTTPQIVINPIELDESNFKFGGVQGRKMVNAEIECYARIGDYMDQLASQVRRTMLSNTLSGMDIIGITSDRGVTEANDAQWQRKSLMFSYMRE